MTNLTQELVQASDYYRTQVYSAEQMERMDQDIEALSHSGFVNRSLQVGDRIPNFSLPDANGDLFELQTLLESGPTVISFYRGMWCPYCSLELRALEEILPTIQALGACLVSISPQTRRSTRSTSEQQNLTHIVLSDVDNQIARQFGIVYQITEPMRQVFEEFGLSLEKFNGSGAQELPVPAIFVVTQDGIIAHRFVDPDFTKRMDPVEIITVLSKLNKSRQPQLEQRERMKVGFV
jgi:peroxiredoxin